MSPETQELIETIERLHALRNTPVGNVPVMGGYHCTGIHPAIDQAIQALCDQIQERLAASTRSQAPAFGMR